MEKRSSNAPAYSEKENNEQLWRALKNGVLDFVWTDHSPTHPQWRIAIRRFMKAWGGIASLQYSLSALWTAAKQHSFNIIDIAKWLSWKSRFIAWRKRKEDWKRLWCRFWYMATRGKFIVPMLPFFFHHRHKFPPYFFAKLFWKCDAKPGLKVKSIWWKVSTFEQRWNFTCSIKLQMFIW